MSIQELKAKYRPHTIHPPQCCASCEHLNLDGVCVKYKQQVPVEHLEAENDCRMYSAQVPF